MTEFLIVCGQQIEIGRRVITFLEQGAPSFYSPDGANAGQPFGQRPGIPTTATLDQVRDRITMLCIHHDATWNSLACFEVLKRRGLSSHIFIDGDGTIYQPLDLRDNAWHAGEVNNYSVGLDMNNVASPDLLIDTEQGRRYAEARGGLVTSQINGANISSCGYSEEQYLSLVAVILGLHKVFPRLGLFPPLDQSGEVINRKIVNYEAFGGFCGHMHVSASKWDPGPGFDWRRVMVGLHGERNAFPIALPNVKNLNELYSAGETEQVAEAYYINNETGWSGFYPISLSQSWNSGIHFNVSAGQPVLCMSRGTIVAVRNTQDVELGSPNFVLVRHTVRTAPPPPDDDSGGKPEAKPDGKKGEETFIERSWYSLYMHMSYIEETMPLEKRPAWHRLMGQDELAGGEYVEPDLEEEAGDRIPKVGKNFRDLRARRIVLTDYEVKAGEVIGYVGSFGSSEDQVRSVLRVDTFSCEDEPLFEPSEYPEIWKSIESDEGNDSLVDIDQLWRPIFDVTNYLKDDAKERRDERILTGAEIQEFYQGDSREKIAMRGYVCRHVSEWSDDLDWKKTAALAVGWQWETEDAYKRFLDLWAPFRWMVGEVVDHAGLSKDRKVWTYHPVTLLAWFHTNYGRQLSPEEYQEGFSNSALVEQRELERAAAETNGYKEGWHGSGEKDTASISSVELTQLQLDDEPWKHYEQGEWPAEGDY